MKKVEYSFPADGKISVQFKYAREFRGERKKWFALLVSCDGQTVDAFVESAKRLGYAKRYHDSAKGWLRFFVSNRIVRIVE